MTEKKKIAILGSTGSIGTQTLRVVEEHSDMFEVRVLTAHSNVELLIEQARAFNPDTVVIANEEKYEQLQDAIHTLWENSKFIENDTEFNKNLIWMVSE